MPSNPTGMCLSLVMTSQQPFYFLCWAAVADSVAAFYHERTGVPQERWCDMIKVLKKCPSCPEFLPNNKHCDRPGDLRKVLKEKGFLFKVISVPPGVDLAFTFEDLKREIRERVRPIAVRLKSPNHYRGVVGFLEKGSTRYVVLEDPRRTLSVQSFVNTFVKIHDQAMFTMPNGGPVLDQTPEACSLMGLLMRFQALLLEEGVDADLSDVFWPKSRQIGYDFRDLFEQDFGVYFDDAMSIVDFEWSIPIPVTLLDWTQLVGREEGDANELSGTRLLRHLISFRKKVLAVSDVLLSEHDPILAGLEGGGSVSSLIQGLRVAAPYLAGGGAWSLRILEVQGLQVSFLILSMGGQDSGEGLLIPLAPAAPGLDVTEVYPVETGLRAAAAMARIVAESVSE